MGLLQNISVLSAEPIKNMGGAAVQCIIRSSYNRSEQQFNRYIGYADFSKKSGVPNGYAPPYSIVIPLKGGGMSCYGGIVSSGSLTITSLALGKALSSISAIVGTGSISSNLKGISHLLSDLSASGEISSANIVGLAILNASLDGSGTIDISSIIKLLYWCLANLEASGTITSSELKLLAGLSTDLIIGSGTIDDASLGMLSFLNSQLSGDSLVEADLKGLVEYVSSLIGTGSLEADASLLIGMTSELLGYGFLDSYLMSVTSLISSILGEGELNNVSVNFLSNYLSSLSGDGDITSADLRSYAQMISNLEGVGAIGALVTLTGLLWLLSEAVGEGIVTSDIRGKSDLSANISLTGAVLTAADCARAVWDSLAADSNDPGTMGEKLNAAGTAGDPWTAELPGTYVEGTAGYIIGNKFEDILEKVNILLDVEQGDWEIKDNQMIFYDRDGDELMRFDLLDSSGDPTETSVYKREKV
jgi:hypothetical protein